MRRAQARLNHQRAEYAPGRRAGQEEVEWKFFLEHSPWPISSLAMDGLRTGGALAYYAARATERMATLTGAIGVGSRWLLDRIVGGLAATGINPNVLTFVGLLVNFWAAAMFATG